MSNLERLPLKAVVQLKRDKIGANEVDLKNYTSVENLLADKAGRVQPAKMPNSGRLDSYEIDDILVGNIRPYLKKIWHSDHAGGTNGDVLVFQARKDVENPVLPRYLYHILASDQYFQHLQDHRKEGKMPRGDRHQALDFEILLPLPEVQEQIVTMLDTFTALEASLNRELELREVQSARYRELLLSFSEGKNGSQDLSYPVQAIAGLLEELGTGSVPTVPLSDFLLDLRTGLNPRKNFTLNTPDADNHYITVRELGGFTIEPTPDTDLVNAEGLTKISRRCRLEQDDILFSGVGTIGRTAIVHERPTNWGIKEGIFALTLDPSRADSRYLIYWFHSSHFKGWLASVTSHGSMATISMTNLKKAPVPLPSLNIQRHIVAILDMFTDYTANLRREIDFRRQQLEYYREQLLTFPVAE